MNYLAAVDLFYPDQPSGAGRVAWDIGQVMRDRGHSVTFFVRKAVPEAAETEIVEGIRVVRFALPKTASLDPWKMQKQAARGRETARRHLLDTRWDAVHIHIALFGKILHSLLGAGPKYVETVHSPIVLEQQINWSEQGWKGNVKWSLGRRALKRLEGGLLRRMDKIHTLSEFTKNVLDASYGVGDKITVIPHWCRKDYVRVRTREKARAELGWPAEGRMLFAVRRFAARMGLDVAIRAMEPLLKEYADVYLCLAGAGPLWEPMKSLAKSLGVEGKIFFPGRVSEEDLRRCYEGADLFLLPTRSLECFGLPILEAFAYGLPVISTDAAAIPELMKPVLPDCVVPAGDVIGFRETIRAYLEGRLPIPGSQQLIDYANREYGRDRVTARHIRFLES